jgi:putative DNA primase/helicase
MRVPSGVNTLGSGLDVRADGAYVVVPPSRHRSGNHYRWSADGRPDVAGLTSLPAWLIDLLVANRQQPRIQGHELIAINEAIPEGSRNDSLARIAGVMRRRGCSEAAILAALLTENDRRCQPPLPESEVGKIARSIASYPSAPARPSRPPRAQQFTPFGFRDGKAEAR